MKIFKLMIFSFLFSCSYKIALDYESKEIVSHYAKKEKIAIVPFYDDRSSKDIDIIFENKKYDVPTQMTNLFIRDLKNANIFQAVHLLSAKNIQRSQYLSLAKNLDCDYVMFTKIKKFEEEIKVPKYKSSIPLVLCFLVGIAQGMKTVQTSHGNISGFSESPSGGLILGFVLTMMALGISVSAPVTYSPTVSLEIDIVDLKFNDAVIISENFENSFSKKKGGKVKAGIFLIEAFKETSNNIIKSLGNMIKQKK